MPRSLAAGRTKFTILTTKPANPAAPTLTELNAGIDLSCVVMASDFTWGATDSDKVAEAALCVTNNAQAIGNSNYQAGFTLFRYFPTAPATPDPLDAGFQAMKAKGATLWGYARRTEKLSTAAWAALDEIYLGAEFNNDEPQPPSDLGGYIKWRTPAEIQTAYPWIAAAAA